MQAYLLTALCRQNVDSVLQQQVLDVISVVGTEVEPLLVLALQALSDTVAEVVHPVLQVGTEAEESLAAHAAEYSLGPAVH